MPRAVWQPARVNTMDKKPLSNCCNGEIESLTGKTIKVLICIKCFKILKDSIFLKGEWGWIAKSLIKK